MRSLIITLLLFSCSDKIAIQPFEKIPAEDVKAVQVALSNYYDTEVDILPTIPLPKEAFVNIKTPRYRADYLIDYLKETKDSKYGYIIGLTKKDISTTKYTDWKNKVIKQPESRYKDFGIFGLGYRPGPSCIVSTYRLGNGTQMKERLVKISCHEIGHNKGLKHCESEKCFMRDAAEKISTIDNVTLDLCGKCKREIGIE